MLDFYITVKQLIISITLVFDFVALIFIPDPVKYIKNFFKKE